ncbi:hypothetical protein TB1_011865 [Malus domestica]
MELLLVEIQAFAFSKAGLLRDHEGRSQKSKRCLLSQKLGCSKTTKADLRNRKGACFLKSWAAQRPRGPISEIEEAATFPALAAPVTRTLSFAEIMGILSKTSGETSKHAQPLLTFEKTLPTRLLAPKSKRHCPPNLESQTPNMTTFSKIEERTSKHAQPLLTFEKTLPTRLLAPKSKRHRPPNLESQTPNMITFSKIEETPLSESREPDPQHDCFLKNRRDIVLRISRARSLIGLLVRKPKRQHFPNYKSRISLDKAVCNLHTQHQLSTYHRPLFQSALTG